MHYGHTLQFGTFITPANTSPETPVRLAQLSKQLGYDLVTFQDHPYQPGYFDTWTLLTVEIDGAPHGMLWTHSDEVNAMLLPFVQK